MSLHVLGGRICAGDSQESIHLMKVGQGTEQGILATGEDIKAAEKSQQLCLAAPQEQARWPWCAASSPSALPWPFCLQYKKADNQFYIFADDTAPRYCTSVLPLDYDTFAVADKFGNLGVLRLPADISAQVLPGGVVASAG